jgi:hypothetical protein
MVGTASTIVVKIFKKVLGDVVKPRRGLISSANTVENDGD